MRTVPGTRVPREDAPAPELLERVLEGLRALPDTTRPVAGQPVAWNLVRRMIGDREVYKHQVTFGGRVRTTTGDCDSVLEWLGPQLSCAPGADRSTLS